MASFQAKTGRDRLRMREKKYSHSDPFNHDPEWGIPKKKARKMQKIKKHYYDFFSSQNGSGEAEKERKKNYRFDQFLADQE